MVFQPNINCPFMFRFTPNIACVASVPVRAERSIGPREGVFTFGAA